MRIEKKATNVQHCLRRCAYFPRAREAFKAFLIAAKLRATERILLPAYVGWSQREGSGVFDPIEELGIGYCFYRVDRQLRIRLEDIERHLQNQDVRVLLIIHYFGYVDPGYAAAVELGHKYGAMVVEDSAHAMLSDLIGGKCATLGDLSIYSLHKLLPVDTGGILIENGVPISWLNDVFLGSPDGCSALWKWDLRRIARKRCDNASLLSELLQPLAGVVDPLLGEWDPGLVPQTFPVCVPNRSRDELYFVSNDAGYGVVSLYHTLIKAIRPDEFPDSHAVSSSILNLPVHQDCSADAMSEMVLFLRRQLSVETR